VDISFICFFFFFSSRRRHTRSDRDWSSDVCSSDLQPFGEFLDRITEGAESARTPLRLGHRVIPPIARKRERTPEPQPAGILSPRSEERRVGKECRSRWAPDY